MLLVAQEVMDGLALGSPQGLLPTVGLQVVSNGSALWYFDLIKSGLKG